MAKKAAPKKDVKEKKKRSGSMDGLRRASAVRKQVSRWQERKWPIATNAEEWLRFAYALEGEAQVIKSQALQHVNPSLLTKSKADLMRDRARAVEAATGGDNE